MLKSLVIALLVLLTGLLLPAGARAGVALDRPTTLSVELLGRGLLYSLNLDHSLNDQVALGAGVGAFSISSGFTSATVIVVPVYVNYAFAPDNHRPFITGGVDLLIASSSGSTLSGFPGSTSTFGAAAVVGGGYEYRGSNGFVFRAAPYLFIAGGAALWFGLGFGYAF